MSDLERETPPAVDRGRGDQESSDNVPCQNSPILPGTDGTGDQKCLLPDPAAAVDFLGKWRPGGPWVLSAIEVDPPKGRDGKVPTRTVTTPAEVVEFINSYSGGRWNIYFTYNVTRGPISKKPTKADMAEAVALCFDLDPRAGEPLDAERARLFSTVDDWEVDDKKLPFPRPNVVIDSGGGVQGFMILEEPVALDGEGVARVEERGLGISQAFAGNTANKKGDSVQNVDRIMRLPGTINWPNEKKRKRGQVPRLARVVSEDWTRRSRLDQFPRAAVDASPAPAATAARGQVASARASAGAVRRIASLDELGPDVDDHTKMLIVQGTDPDDPDKWADRRSQLVLHINCELIRADVSEADMVALMLDPDYKFGAHVQEQPKPLPYAWRQVTRALEHQPRLGPIIINQPLELARAFQKHRRPNLLRFEGEFLDWDGAAYVKVNPEMVEAEMWRFLETCRVRRKDDSGKETVVPYIPMPDPVSGALRAFKAVSIRPDEGAEVYPIRWLDERSSPDPKFLLPGRDGIMDLRTGEVLPATPMLFTRVAVDFTPDPNAPEPEVFLGVLDQYFPGDEGKEKKRAFQEMGGLMLTADTSAQQHFMFVGPTRSGKGTLIHVLTEMVGVGNVASATTNSLCEGDFGLAPLLGKTMLAIPDLRIDSRTKIANLQQNFLSIMGEDRMGINVKNRDHVQAQLRVKMVIAANELPSFNDTSGALAERLVIIMMTETFKDNPDPKLKEKLRAELPGILNWFREGLLRVLGRERARVVVPESAREARREMVDLANPALEFVEACCELDPSFEVGNAELYEAFLAWFKGRRKEDWHAGDKHFFRKLNDACPGKLQDTRPREDGKRPYKKAGIRLNPDWAGGKIGG